MHAPTDTIVDEIRQINARFENTFSRGDASGMASLYTAEGMLLPAGSDAVQGQAAIGSYWQQVMNQGFSRVELHTVEVDHVGRDAAVELGTYHMRDAANQVLDQGKYIVVWKQEDGEWKLQRDIWNSNSAQ
ncbi:SgcJ/EcaC family oxidoreductase [Hymenobacter busanensis]|uniref:SgcJ/EcaC family oxidoreductase n=1 Tax=Hymenobacter busanensis TaxID=2607656 RepID=A0A7L5A297_9BACT|nr:SgcJ/EcaC family oxidoreductase [Hymenobacter busanensis]KAA9338339.1 SgcJ/EcaC family oxidoreductase [Hymenobacter busanensis]QHJ09236.1 SgcJ/EcaC family oxidoreductase [Hymenobacter busanensis]